MGSGNSVGSREVQSLNVATTRAWSRKTRSLLLMKDHLTSVQYLVYNDLRRQLSNAFSRRKYNPSMESDAACATLTRELLRLEVMLCERLRERWRENIDQVEEQNAAEKAQRQAELAQREVNFQLKVQERETKVQKVQDEKEKSGVGFSVEQFEFNRDKPENAAKLEKYRDAYYHRLHCSNKTHPEDLEYHAAEIAYHGTAG